MTVAAAPALEITVTGLLSASMQSHPGAGVSSPSSPSVPSKSRSPYIPGPTTTVSFGAA